MTKYIVLLSMIISIGILASFAFDREKNTGLHTSFNNDSIAQERQRYSREVMDMVGDRTTARADSVFKNLRIFTGDAGIRAEHFIGVMNYWGRALGVSCTYCHNPGDWASEEKINKETARDMFALRQSINRQISLDIKKLKKVEPIVNCGTCHNGKPIPNQN